MKPPFLSIVTVTKNNHTGLVKTARSITEQSFKKFEWIIVDGNSKDETFKFLNTLTRPAIIIRENDTGIYDAMNKGLERACGQYILFLNAGDCLASANTLEALDEFITQNNRPEFIYGDSLEQVDRHKFYKPSKPHNAMTHCMFTHHQSMIYKATRAKTVRYNLQYKIASDYDFTLRYLMDCSDIQYFNHPLCIFESGGISQRNTSLGRKEQFSIRQKHEINSTVKNLYIWSLQYLTWNLRIWFPKIYWAIKSQDHASHD